jgi:hypothetical protein
MSDARCREPRQSAKIGVGIAARFRAVTDRVNRLGRLDRPAIALVVLDNQLKKIGAIRLALTKRERSSWSRTTALAAGIGCGWGNSIIPNIQDREASSSRASFKSSLST